MQQLNSNQRGCSSIPLLVGWKVSVKELLCAMACSFTAHAWPLSAWRRCRDARLQGPGLINVAVVCLLMDALDSVTCRLPALCTAMVLHVSTHVHLVGVASGQQIWLSAPALLRIQMPYPPQTPKGSGLSPTHRPRLASATLHSPTVCPLSLPPFLSHSLHAWQSLAAVTGTLHDCLPSYPHVCWSACCFA